MAAKQGVMLLATLFFAAGFGVSTAKTVTVGGNTGWAIPPSASFYSNWASKQNLQVGDKLVFTFPAGMHTAAEVSKANFDACSTTSTIGPVMTTSPTTITLASAGTHYFICTIPGHCSANQKVAVTIAAAASLAPKTKAPTMAPMMAPTSAPKMAPMPTPKMAPTPSAMTPTPTTSSAPAPTPGAVTPSASATPPMPATTPTGSPSEASGPSGAGAAASPPKANSAASTGVTLMSLLSIVAAFLVC